MILHYIRTMYGKEITVPASCPLDNENFGGYGTLLSYDFDMEAMPKELQKQVEDSDDLEQRAHYAQLWQEIKSPGAGLARKRSQANVKPVFPHGFSAGVRPVCGGHGACARCPAAPKAVIFITSIERRRKG
ncbi:MAG TPA: hypothetical protein H9684_07475 [Firmicutes bacterium]|nr:hypothetical protein [Bacillota bacterium]